MMSTEKWPGMDGETGPKIAYSGSTQAVTTSSTVFEGIDGQSPQREFFQGSVHRGKVNQSTSGSDSVLLAGRGPSSLALRQEEPQHDGVEPRHLLDVGDDGHAPPLPQVDRRPAPDEIDRAFGRAERQH